MTEISNPLLDRWLELERGRQWPRIDDWYLPSERRPRTDEEYEQSTMESARINRARHDLRVRYAYAIPNDEALNTIARYGPVVEVGAGLGYWAWLLRQHGVDVVAADELDESAHWFHLDSVPWIDDLVVADAEEFAAAHPDRTLLLVWPPYADDMAARALRGYLDAGGQTVVYVGEDEDGCTGDEAFHRLLATAMDEVACVAIPRWEYLKDRLTVWAKRTRR